MSLSGKVALVTGGSRGIGRAICIRLAGLGATVLVNYVSNPAAAEETGALIAAEGGRALPVRFDVADGLAIASAIKQIETEHGGVDILVNNAGITRDGLFVKMKDEAWDEVMATNLRGAFLCCRAVVRGMMKKRSGRIINVTSVIGFTGNAGQANYAAAKAGLVGMSKSLAREVASRGITVNCVAPGYIDTDMTRGLDDGVKERIRAEIPSGIFGSAEDIAAAVGFLAGGDARYITGECIHVNGGMYMA
ncbi:MAG: 3-oxoacyl-[acyl-carrier-protein] reductase [Thermodesulfobacteriota bacterium]